MSILSTVASAVFSVIKAKTPIQSKTGLALGTAVTAVSLYYFSSASSSCTTCIIPDSYYSSTCSECAWDLATGFSAVAIGGAYAARNALKNGLSAANVKVQQWKEKIEKEVTDYADKQKTEAIKQKEAKIRANLTALTSLVQKGGWGEMRTFIAKMDPPIEAKDFLVLAKEAKEIQDLFFLEVAAPWAREKNWTAANFNALLSPNTAIDEAKDKLVVAWATEWAHQTEIKADSKRPQAEILNALRSCKNELANGSDPKDFTLPPKTIGSEKRTKAISHYQRVNEEVLREQELNRPEVVTFVDKLKSRAYGEKLALKFAKAIGRIQDPNPKLSIDDFRNDAITKSFTGLRDYSKKNPQYAKELMHQFFAQTEGAFDTQTRSTQAKIQQRSKFDERIAKYKFDINLIPHPPENAKNEELAKHYYNAYVHQKIFDFVTKESQDSLQQKMALCEQQYCFLRTKYLAYKEGKTAADVTVVGLEKYMEKHPFNDYLKANPELVHDAKEWESYNTSQTAKLGTVDKWRWNKENPDWWSPYIAT